MSNQNTDYLGWFWLVLLLLFLAIASLYSLWGNQPKFSDTMSIVDKHWERKVMLQREECDEDSCGWQTFKTERLKGNNYRPVRWPKIREPESWERLEKKETYFIDFSDREDKIHTFKTHKYWQYKSSKISSVHPVIINNFGGVKEILPETINN